VLKPKKSVVALHRDSKDINGMNAYNHKKNNSVPTQQAISTNGLSRFFETKRTKL